MLSSALVVAVSAESATASGGVSLVKPPPAIDVDQVANGGGVVDVSVRNDDPSRAQRFEVRLVGLSALPAVTAAGTPTTVNLAPAGASSESVPAGGTDVVALALDVSQRPNPDTYQATLIASGSLGGNDVAKVPVTVAPPAAAAIPAAVSAHPPRLLPKTLSDFSVDGINFVPSLLNPGPAAALGAGLLLALLLLPFVTIKGKLVPAFLRRTAMPLPPGVSRTVITWAYIVATVLIILGCVAAFGKGKDGYPDDGFFVGNGLSLVEVSAPRVGLDAQDGAVGSLVSKDGTPAMAVVDHGRLHTESAPRAGTYEGKIDLLAVEGGDAKMTANVRDYWPWALLVIAAGVLVGATVTRYFTIRRGQARLLLELTQLRDEIRAADADFRSRAPEAYAGYAIARRLGQRLNETQERLTHGEPDEMPKVTEELDAVRTYFETTRELWGQVERLAGSAVRVGSLAKTKNFGLVGDELPAVQEALRLVQDPFVDDLPDEDGTDLKARKTAVDDTVALLEQLRVALTAVAALRNAMANLDTSALTKDDLKTLQDLKETFGSSVNELLSASSVANAQQSLAKASAAFGEIRDLVKRRGGADANQALFADLTIAPRAAFTVGQPLPPELISTEAAPTPREPVDPNRARQLWDNFKRTDRQMTLATGTLAVLSGLLAVYSISPTWGTPGDYLKAFLWGSVVSEGVKQVAALVSRTSPAG